MVIISDSYFIDNEDSNNILNSVTLSSSSSENSAPKKVLKKRKISRVTRQIPRENLQRLRYNNIKEDLMTKHVPVYHVFLKGRQTNLKSDKSPMKFTKESRQYFIDSSEKSRLITQTSFAFKVKQSDHILLFSI